MVVLVNGRPILDALRTLLNPRLLMVYALLGGSAVRAVRQRRWRSRRRERWRRERESVRKHPELEESADDD